MSTLSPRLLAVLAAAALCGAPKAADAEVVHTLHNGLRVIIEARPEMTEVAVAVAYRVGHRDNPKGYAGLAHLAEHMAFRSTRNLPGLRGYEVIAELGGRSQGTTHFDATVYTQAVPIEGLERALWVESERMGYLVEAVDAKTLALEKRIVARELDMRRGADGGPGFVLEQVFPEPHPYYLSPDEAADVQAVTLSGLQGFLQRYYRPDAATIAIVGDVSAQDVLRLVEAHFAAIPRPRGRLEPRNEFLPPPTCVEAEGSVRGRALSLMLWRLPDPGPVGEAEVLTALIQAEADSIIDNPAVSVKAQLLRWDLETVMQLTVKASSPALAEIKGPVRRVLGELGQRIDPARVIRTRDAVAFGLAQALEAPADRAEMWARSGVSTKPSPVALETGVAQVDPQAIMRRVQALSGSRPDVWIDLDGRKAREFPKEFKFHRTLCRRL